jgi:two-component system NtrC family sensor kinase
METIEPNQTTHIHLDKNDNEIYCSISTYPLIEEGDIVGVVEITRDITHEINIQKTLMQQEKLVSVGRLSAGVAHEINNPLTTILTTAMLLQEDIDADDPMHADLETIAQETLRCRKIVTSLLDFARQTRPKKKANDINAIITESVLLARKQAAFKDIDVRKDLTDDLPMLHLDKGQIQQVLINLILNAIESTRAGGNITLRTALLTRRQAVQISVSDTGEGIPEELIDKVFDPFFTTKEEGTGLGLAITHGIIEQHGGTIEVRNREQGGTTFTIKIPLRTDATDDT